MCAEILFGKVSGQDFRPLPILSFGRPHVQKKKALFIKKGPITTLEQDHIEGSPTLKVENESSILKINNNEDVNVDETKINYESL